MPGFNPVKVVPATFSAGTWLRLDARRRGCRAPSARPRGPPRACQRRRASRPELPEPAEECAHRRRLDSFSAVLRCWRSQEPKLRLPDELLWHPLLPALHRRCTGARFGAAQRGYGQGVRFSPPAVHPHVRGPCTGLIPRPTAFDSSCARWQVLDCCWRAVRGRDRCRQAEGVPPRARPALALEQISPRTHVAHTGGRRSTPSFESELTLSTTDGGIGCWRAQARPVPLGSRLRDRARPHAPIASRASFDVNAQFLRLLAAGRTGGAGQWGCIPATVWPPPVTVRSACMLAQ